MSLPQFHAAMDGYVQAHAAAERSGITEDEFTRALAEEMAAGRA